MGFSPYILVFAERMLGGVMREEKRVPRVSSAHALHINIHNQFLVRLAQAQASRQAVYINRILQAVIYYQHYLPIVIKGGPSILG